MLVSELVEANNEESKKKTKVNQDNVAHIKRKRREGKEKTSILKSIILNSSWRPFRNHVRLC